MFLPYLDWIESQAGIMLDRIKDWVDINSHSLNTKGLAAQLSSLKRDFSSLDASSEEIPLNPIKITTPQGKPATVKIGSALHFSKRKEAPLRFFFAGHFDTVYTEDSGFLHSEMLDEKTLRGPGAADMKGGIAVMLTAIEAIEKSPFAKDIGYEILLNPDEEIGSPGSSFLFEKLSYRCQAALLFEPSLSGNCLASARKGSANYTVLVKGKSAHAGRDFFSGKNAIATLSELLVNIHKLNHPENETTLNLGYIYGGGPINIVPDLAMCRINIRASTDKEMQLTESKLGEMIQNLEKKHEVTCEMILESRRPPKPFDEKTEKLFIDFKECSEELGEELTWRSTGGACDGNTTAALGIPTIDSLGAIGANIHTKDEYLLIDSLVKRAKLTALYLMKAAYERSK